MTAAARSDHATPSQHLAWVNCQPPPRRMACNRPQLRPGLERRHHPHPPTPRTPPPSRLRHPRREPLRRGTALSGKSRLRLPRAGPCHDRSGVVPDRQRRLRDKYRPARQPDRQQHDNQRQQHEALLAWVIPHRSARPTPTRDAWSLRLHVANPIVIPTSAAANITAKA